MIDESNSKLFNPFAPMFLKTKVEEETRLKLLDVISDLKSNGQKDPDGKQIIIGPDANQAQANSIVAGDMENIHARWQLENHNNIIEKTVKKILRAYSESFIRFSNKNWDFMDAYGKPSQRHPKDITDTNIAITDVWYVTMKAGDFHLLHTHDVDDCSLSGAIYLDVPELVYPQGMMNWIVTGNRKLSNEVFRLRPVTGDVMVWPSWVLHTVYPFRGDSERTMISFNGYF